MFTKLAALFAFAIALNCSAAAPVALPNPIVLVHGIQPIFKPFGAPDDYTTWSKYYEALTPASGGYVGGGVWRANTRGGRTAGATCVVADDTPPCNASGAVFIVSFTSGSDLTFSEQGGELAAILLRFGR